MWYALQAQGTIFRCGTFLRGSEDRCEDSSDRVSWLRAPGVGVQRRKGPVKVVIAIGQRFRIPPGYQDAGRNSNNTSSSPKA